MKPIGKRSRDQAKDRKAGEATDSLATENSDSRKQYAMCNTLVLDYDDDQSNNDRVDRGDDAE